MKVLFVQEQPFLGPALKLSLMRRGYDLIFCDYNSLPSFNIENLNPHLLISDIGNEKGFDYVIEAKKKNVPVIVISANERKDELKKAFELGADDYINLPISTTELLLRVSILTKSKKNAA